MPWQNGYDTGKEATKYLLLFLVLRMGKFALHERKSLIFQEASTAYGKRMLLFIFSLAPKEKIKVT